ncbi:MAG: 50S ribosomal protein L18 [Candidatus Diapherotrites archaeon]
MSHKSTYATPFRRRKEQKTNYKKRLALLKSKQLRLVVRKSNNNLIAEVVEYFKAGDKTRVFVHSNELKDFGWTRHAGNIPAAYLTGYLCGKKAVKEKIESAILDMGLNTPVHGSRIFAGLKGAIDGGLKIKADEKVFPSGERIRGGHISPESEKNFQETLENINKKFGEKNE